MFTRLSVPISILFYMIQNTIDVTCITSTRHKNEKIVKMKFILIYRYKNSCTDNEETEIMIALW